MKKLKKYIPIALGMFVITLTSRIALNDGNFEMNHIISALIMAIVISLSTAFFDSHPMNDEE
jgi:hypothetical protein